MQGDKLPDTSYQFFTLNQLPVTSYQLQFLYSQIATRQKSRGVDRKFLSRWGWVFESSLQRISSKFLLWKRNDSWVVLYTWSWRGKPAATTRTELEESKRGALGNYFSEQICYIFLMSKCRGDQDLGLCTTSVLAFGELQRNGKIRFLKFKTCFFFGFCHRTEDDEKKKRKKG